MAAIAETLRRIRGANLAQHGPSVVVGLGHGTTHWTHATLFVLMPFIGQDLGLSYTEIGSVVSILYVAGFCANAASGPLVDLTGRHIVFQAASVILAALALITLGFATSFMWLVALVILIGVSASLWHPAAFTFLALRYPTARGLAMSIHTLGASLGDTLAPIFAGLLLTTLTWNETALAAAGPVIAILVLMLVALREPAGENAAPRRHASGADYLAGLLLLIRDHAILRVCAASAIRSAIQNGLLLFLPLYLVGVLAAGPAAVGTTIMVLNFGGIISGPLAGAWSDRAGRRPVALAAFAATTVLVAAVTFMPSAGGLIVLAGFLGFALFALRPVVQSWTVDLAADSTPGSAVGLLFMFQVAFTAVVPVVGGMIADAWGLEAVFHILIVLCLAALALLVSMPKSRTSPA